MIAGSIPSELSSLRTKRRDLSALARLCGLSLVLVFGPAASEQGTIAAEPPRPLRVRAQIERGPYYVGQAITLQVSVVAGRERPRVVTPRVADCEVTPTETELKPISSSGIGSFVMEKNDFLARFRLVPRRAGRLTIPAVRARLDSEGRSGASAPITITVASLPTAGRPAAFLGGVGTFEVSAEADPPEVRRGQSLEFRIKVTGSAARGMSRAPTLERLQTAARGTEIEAKPVEAVDDPPSRVFRYQVRPTVAGELVLPPVAIAAFNPRLGQYVTRVSPGLHVRVVDVPRFDPSSLDYAPPPRASDAWAPWAARGLLAMAAALALAASGRVLRRWFVRHRAETAAVRLLARLRRDLPRTAGAAEAGRRTTEALAEYLALAIGRPRGALTPDEARAGITRASGDAAIGEQARRLVAVCDQAQFAGQGVSAQEVIGEADRLFQGLVSISSTPRVPMEGDAPKNRERQS
jgi:hypothetical protein